MGNDTVGNKIIRSWIQITDNVVIGLPSINGLHQMGLAYLGIGILVRVRRQVNINAIRWIQLI